MIEEKKPTGYVTSRHIFGRSLIGRDGNKLYYLYWQWNKNKTFIDIIWLTNQMYQDLKGLLLPLEIKDIQTKEYTDGFLSKISFHQTNSKCYRQVKKYLIKHKLLKEKTK
jgi:hypothetical protein